MDNSYLSMLNDKQLEAVTSDLGSTLVIAGAGSGKTAVLVYRIIHLVKAIGFDSKRILAFTFTNKAAEEMKKRVSELIPNSSFQWIGTFHGICLRILREDVNVLNRKNDFTIVDEDDQLSIIKEIYSKFGIDKSKLAQTKCLGYIQTLKSNKIFVNDCDESIAEFLEIENSEKKVDIIINVYKEYEEYLVSNNLFDFEDLIKYTLMIFDNHPNILNKWQNRFDYILVDEFQDTNLDQYKLIKHLSKTKSNILVVGDPDQMIYSWRGAYKEIFRDFISDFSDILQVILDQNYRSTKSILNVSNSLIKHNINRIEKDLHTNNNGGTKVMYYHSTSEERESRWVIDKINLLVHNNRYKYKDIAILYRSNFCSRNIEQELIRNNIPYYIFGGFKFYQRKEIKDMIAYLKVISINDEVSLSRIYNTPKRKISETTFAKIKEYSYHHNISTLEAFDQIENIDSINQTSKNACIAFRELIADFKNKKFKSLTDMFEYVYQKSGYKQSLEDEQENNRIENIQELKRAISEYEFRNPNSSLIEYMQEISLFTSLDDGNANTVNSVSLMTVHTSKGLEFKNVFIIQFNDGIFPSQRSIDSNSIDEERRIAYVAMTRAKENLFISSSDGISFFSNSKTNKLPSRFYKEIENNPFLEVNIETKQIWHKHVSSNDELLSPKQDYSKYFHDSPQEYNIGDEIIHSMLGEGVVVGIDKDIIDISFLNSKYGKRSFQKNHKTLRKKVH